MQNHMTNHMTNPVTNPSADHTAACCATECCTPDTGASVAANRDTFRPRADLVETDASFEIVLDLPGVAPDAVDVDVEDGALSIAGRVSATVDRAVLRQEFHSGDFRRTFRLGRRVDASGITARCEDGVLTVTVPKVAAATRRRIAVGS